MKTSINFYSWISIDQLSDNGAHWTVEKRGELNVVVVQPMFCIFPKSSV